MKIINMKISMATLFTFLMLITGCQFTEQKVNYDSQVLNQQKVSLAGQWAFQTDPYKQGTKQQWWQTDTDIKHWDNIAVPGVWDVYDKYSDYMGDAWYRTEFVGDKSWAEQQIRLVFDSVYHDSEVWLNDQYLGANKLGFMAFEFDVSEYVKLHETNTLVVKVNNRFRRGAVWNWGGIRRPVYLEVRPETHIEKVYVTSTPNLNDGSAEVKVETFVTNLSNEPIKPSVALSLNLKDQPVAQFVIPTGVTITPQQQTTFTHTFNLSAQQVALWHFNDPNLYTVQADLLNEQKLLHSHVDRFGIRKVEVKDRKLFLNGEPVRLVGLNMVPEDRFDGNALPLSRIKEDVDLLKSLNANFARLSGPALPKEYLDYLDEVGFLVVEEVALWGKDELVDPDHPLPKQWLERLVSDNYNHPSVIARSVGNEIGDLTKNPKVLEYVEGAIAHAKELDPTRLGVYISYSADFQPNDSSKFSDIIMFNKYGSHEERLKVVDSYHPTKPIFFSEIGTHLDGVDPNESILDVEKLMGPLRKYPYLIGTSHFAFSDYRSTWYDEKPSWSTDFSQNRAWGVLTSYRNKKRSFTKLQDFYSPLEIFELDSATNTLKITSRARNSFPSYTMKGYRVVWQALDNKGNSLAIGQVPLPTLQPGDTAPAVTLPYDGQYAKLTLTLLDPEGYVSQVKSYDSQLPVVPQIKSHFVSIDTIRVNYLPTALADEYKLIAIDDEGEKVEGKWTINDFAEVTGLKPQVDYKLHLIAKNSAGVSQLDKPQLKIATAPNELPPIIWATEGKTDAFHIGFNVTRKDFAFEIQYGLTPGKYTHSHLIRTKGATRVPAIENGKPHYFQLRRLLTGSIDSDWTDEFTVVLQGESGLLAPQDALAIKAEQGAIVKLTPVRRAVGYKVKATYTDNSTNTIETKLAYSDFIYVKELNLDELKSLEIATISENKVVGEYAAISVIR